MSFPHVSKWHCPSTTLCMSRTQWSRGNCVSGAGKWESEQIIKKLQPLESVFFKQGGLTAVTPAASNQWVYMCVTIYLKAFLFLLALNNNICKKRMRSSLAYNLASKYSFTAEQIKIQIDDLFNWVNSQRVVIFATIEMGRGRRGSEFKCFSWLQVDGHFGLR